jgi:YrbI family 3-deoxy-D-manno-octulosonate 8-phosphate phosphatase
MNCLAIIPARGGSKGIPRKNIRPLAGKPLIAYNIEQARRSRLINRLVVSTDDPEIAAVARQYGAEVVWRPAEISGDTASSELALLHTLEHLEQAEGYQPEIVVFLQCTSPLTLAEDMDGAVQALLDQGADSALAVIPFHYFLWKPEGNGDAVGINHDKRLRPLRQQREPQYLETGAVYVMRAQGFRQARHRFFGKTALYEMPAERRLEIDDPVDFQVAEVLLRAQASEHSLSLLPQPVAAVVFDFDGVFTDNKVITFQDGREAAVSNRSDGWGIARLRETGLPLLVLSTETNPVVQARCAKLRIPCQQGLDNKAEALQRWLDERGLPASQVVYVGNDANDLDCMALVGCPVAVADAYPEALERAALVLEHPGGNGAVREICDLVIKQMQARSA